MSNKEVCEHFVPTDEYCQACEDAGREARLRVQRGETECSMCGDTTREQDGGPVNPLQAENAALKEDIRVLKGAAKSMADEIVAARKAVDVDIYYTQTKGVTNGQRPQSNL